MNLFPPSVGQVPADCERIIIVGAGGFGREVLQWARHAWPEHQHKIAGFLSDDPTKLDGYGKRLPILGSPAGFDPHPGDALVLGIGIPVVRRRVAEHLAARRARFLTLVHPTAIIADNAVIELGTVICPFVIVSDGGRVGRFVLLNSFSSLGHDARVADFGVLSPYATLGGNAHVAEEVFLGLHASIGPGQIVGARTKVSANSCVLTSAPGDCIVFGVPGVVAPQLSVSGQ